VVIRDAERMTSEAANALLKILEEPPADAVLVLLAQSAAQLLPTVVSRCQLIRFWEAAQPADFHNETVDTLVSRLMEAGVTPGVERGAEEDAALDRSAAESVLQELACVFRDLMLIGQGVIQVAGMSRQPDIALKRWARMFDAASLERLVDEMLRMKGYVRGNANIKLSLDLTAKTIAAHKNRS
jgi:DNA polymerase III, gamma/tau subunits